MPKLNRVITLRVNDEDLIRFDGIGAMKRFKLQTYLSKALGQPLPEEGKEVSRSDLMRNLMLLCLDGEICEECKAVHEWPVLVFTVPNNVEVVQ